MKPQKLLVNTVWYGVVPKLPQIITLVTLPFVTPYLTTFDYGVLGIINSYRSMASGIVSLGMGVHLQNSFFEMPKYYKLLWRRIYFYMFTMSFIASVLLTILYLFNLPIVSNTTKLVVITLSIVPLFLSPIKPITDNYYVLKDKANYYVLRNTLGALANVLVTFIVIRYLKWGYMGWIMGLAVGTILTSLMFLKPLLKNKIYPQIDLNFSRFKKLLSISFPIIPHGFGQVIFNSGDKIIMTILGVSIGEIGLYTKGVYISNYLYVIVTGLFVALVPLLQKSYRKKDVNTLRYYYRLSNLIVSISVLIAVLFMSDFYHIVIRNNSLFPSHKVALLMCFSFLFKLTFYNFMMTSIYIEKRTKYVLFLVFYPSIINVVLNLIFIKNFGYMGAVYSTIICSSIIIVLPFSHPFFKEITNKIVGKRSVFWECLLINIFVMSLALFFKDSNYYHKLLVTILFLLISYYYYYYQINKKMNYK